MATPPFLRSVLVTSLLFPGCGFAAGQDLADWFGFSGLELVKIDRNVGPLLVADMNGDGLNDLVVVNNFKSRIEIHFQKKDASPADEVEPPRQVNDFPEHWRFRREAVTVAHRVDAIVANDFDADGLNDLIYVGTPSEIVFLRQTEPGVFELDRRFRERNLQGTKDTLKIADVVGDGRPELLTLAEGEIVLWTMENGSLTKSGTLAAGVPLVAFWTGDFDGDGRLDIAGVSPDDPAPIRLWLATEERGRGVIGPQLRFEMPPLIEAEVVHVPGAEAAALAVIERVSKRIVVYSLESQSVESRGDRDASLRVFAFSDPGNRTRDVAVADLNGDGLLDLVATDTEASALVMYPQVAGRGIQRGESFPSFADVIGVAAGNVDDDPEAEVFVVSEKESVVGRSEVTADGIDFPLPLAIPEGKTPVAMSLVRINDEPMAAVALKDGRSYSLALIGMDGATTSIDLGAASRSPESIVGLDADQDGRTDLLLLTRDKPMMMLHQQSDGFTLRESKDMGQFGLVQAATSENTSVHDVDGDGREELLIADRNYVRAVRFNQSPPPGVSAGWQVVSQINAADSTAKLVAVAVSGDRIFAADRANNRIVVFGDGEDDQWAQRESLHISGFTFSELFTGAFSGDEEENILAVGADGFAIVRLGGERFVLRETNSWRTNDERRREHELTAGDTNNDGFLDLVALDAGDQMLEIFTFSETGRMLYATAFKVFESRLFTGGDARQFEPSQCLIADITGDGANDLILLAHDRVLIYPQMSQAGQE